MAKALTSVIGVDLGRYSLKSVLLQRKGGNRFVVTHYASRVLSGPVDSADTLGQELKALFKTMGGSAKACAVGVSSPDALIRIIEQPETPSEILRDALRLNGMALLNQDCKGFVLDCDEISSSEPATPGEQGGSVKCFGQRAPVRRQLRAEHQQQQDVRLPDQPHQQLRKTR